MTESAPRLDSVFVPYDILYFNIGEAQAGCEPTTHSVRPRLTHPPPFAYIAASRAGPSRPNPLSLDKLRAMSRRCELTGVGPMTGHNVSHSNIKTKRRFLPALAPASLQSDSLGQTFKLKISNAARRTLDFRGGLDVFLLKAKDDSLSHRALKIKKQVKAKLASASAPAA